MGDMKNFHILFILSKLLFTVSFTMVIKFKQSPAGECTSGWRSTSTEIHLCSSGVNSDLEECFFWSQCKPVITSSDL